MKNYKSPFVLLTLCLSMYITGCKNEIELPTPNSEKLIGSWVWVKSTGGFSVSIQTPASEGYHETIEFKKSGAYYKQRDGQQVSYLSYSFFEGDPIESSGTTQLIKYVDIISGTEQNLTHSFNFFGNDSLFLREQCYDCYGHVYVRL